jgi:hypothetical protein
MAVRYAEACPELRRLKQENCKFEVNLGYIARLSQKQTKPSDYIFYHV